MSSRAIFFCMLFGLLGFVGVLYWYSSTHAGPHILFKPQQEKRYQISGDNKPITVLGTILPQFAVSLRDAKFSNLWQAYAAERSEIVDTALVGRTKDLVNVTTTYDDKNKELLLTPETQNTLKPGLYSLGIKIKTVDGKYTTITQDFTWGVLAINPNKAIYQPGEDVKIGMGVLDDIGDTKCIAQGDIKFETAKVWLTITTPSGKEEQFSTDDGTITGSKECGPKTVTNKPDFLAITKADEVGKYQLHMEAENINGKRSIDDSFTVQQNPPPYSIERTSYPTRIYPKANYPVEITIKANKDYSGSVGDVVPWNFDIKDISDGGQTNQKGDYKTIYWNVDWKSGQTYTLRYTIIFPPVSPEFYLVGPFTIGDYDEGRDWQIASDSVFTLVQEKDATSASANSIAATFTNTPGQGHLIVASCYRATSDAANILALKLGGNATSATTTTGTFTAAINNTSTTTTTIPAIYMFYKLAGASEGKTITCTKTDDNATAGGMAIQILEFSGASSATTLGVTGNVDGAACTTTSTTSSITPANPSSLLISAFVATNGSLTVSSHTNSFIDTDINGGSNGFNATAGTYDGSSLELSVAAATSDTITLSGTGGTCANVIATFNNSNVFQQGGFRFFDNENTTTLSNPLALQNTNVTLSNRRFRLRLLLDNQSPSGMTTPQNGGNWRLQFATLPSGGNCGTQTYSDVLSGTTISYASNSAVTNLANISIAGNDPSDGGTTDAENFYSDANIGGSTRNISNFQNAITSGQAGLWDFSLLDNTSVTNNPVTYCFKIVNGDGSNLSSYQSTYPEITSTSRGVNFFGGTTIKGFTTVY